MGSMKRCGLCRALMSFDEFHRRGGGYQTWCKSCRRRYDRAYHRRTRETRLTQKRVQHQRIVEWYRQLKSRTPCADCGRTFHHAAMSWGSPAWIREARRCELPREPPQHKALILSARSRSANLSARTVTLYALLRDGV